MMLFKFYLQDGFMLIPSFIFSLIKYLLSACYGAISVGP